MSESNPTAADAGQSLTPTQRRILTMLGDNGQTTAADIADMASIGRSTANHALARLEEIGLATREPGQREGAVRHPDRWTIANANPSMKATTDAAAATKVSIDGAACVFGEDGEHDVSDDGPPSAATAEPNDPRVVLPPTIPPAPPASDGVPQRPARLRKGELRTMVVQHFERLSGGKPGVTLKPADLHNMLGRSHGAIANACDWLVLNGQLEVADEKPRSYRLVSASVD